LKHLEKERTHIAREVRALRQGRRWTQAELAKRLGLSQARLSEIERGGGSFTAEQLLAIFRLFNVGPSHFAVDARDETAELQNALARLGARHLGESEEALPSNELERAQAVVREAIAVAGAPRLVTALAPVLVQNIERVSLGRLLLELGELGLQRRFVWVLENVAHALRYELEGSAAAGGRGARLAEPWRRRYRRALTVIETNLTRLRVDVPPPTAHDVLDRGLRSKASLEEALQACSPHSKRWQIVTTIQPEDFARALRDARASVQ
jgi:transcriptional regulator with XRE-family HTH domain